MIGKNKKLLYFILAIVWLCFISFISFLWYLGSTGLVDETEPLFAEAARQMTVTNNWITPYFNEETRFDKPPLIYWLMAVGYKLIGVNEWAVRLPSAFGGILLLLISFYTVLYFSDRDSFSKKSLVAAAITTGIMGLNFETIIWGRTGVSDMLLSGFMGSSLLCFFWGYVSSEQNKNLPSYNAIDNLKIPNNKYSFPNKWYLLFYICLSLAVLTKGPVGIVLPGLIIFCFLIYIGKFWEVVKEIKLLWGIIIFLTITLPWYILVFQENGRTYIDSFFGYHNFDRFTKVVNGHDGVWYYYFIIILLLFVPWSLYLPLAINRTKFWKLDYWRKRSRKKHLRIFAFFWFIIIFLFFTVSVTKLPSYILPLIPAASILVGILWTEEITFKNKKINFSLLISILANILIAIALAIAFYLLPNIIEKDPIVPQLNILIKQSLLALRGILIWGGTAIAISCVLINKKYWRSIIVINFISLILFISLVLIPTTKFIDVHRQLPLREIAKTIVEVRQEDEPIWLLGFKKPSLVFYTKQPVEFLKNFTMYDYHVKSNRDLGKLNYPTVLIVGRDKEIRKLPKLEPSEYKHLDRQSVYNLIRVPTQTLINKLSTALLSIIY